jgi:hypothetical protein
MDMIIQYVLLAVLVFGAVATVVSPKAWQRAICLLMSAVVVFLFIWAMSGVVRKALSAKFFATTVHPAAQLWDMTASNLVAGNVTQALHDVQYINQKWTEIRPWNEQYTAMDILREVKDRQSANQAPEAIGAEAAPQPHR